MIMVTLFNKKNDTFHDLNMQKFSTLMPCLQKSSLIDCEPSTYIITQNYHNINLSISMKADLLMSIQPMRQQDIEEVARLTAQSYRDNPFVIKGFSSTEDIRKQDIINLSLLLDAQKIVNKKLDRNTVFNFVVRDNGKIILAYSSCEYHYYVKNFLQKFDKQMTIKNLQQEFKENPMREGEVIYEKRIVVDKEYMGKGIATKFWSQLSLYFLGQGYYYAYSFMSNPKSYQIYKKMGGIIIRDVVYEYNGDQITSSFCFRKIHKMAKSNYFQLGSQ